MESKESTATFATNFINSKKIYFNQCFKYHQLAWGSGQP